MARRVRQPTAKQLRAAYLKYAKASLRAGYQPLSPQDWLMAATGQQPAMDTNIGNPAAAGIASVAPGGLGSSVPTAVSVPSLGAPNISQLLNSGAPAVASALG